MSKRKKPLSEEFTSKWPPHDPWAAEASSRGFLEDLARGLPVSSSSQDTGPLLTPEKTAQASDELIRHAETGSASQKANDQRRKGTAGKAERVKADFEAMLAKGHKRWRIEKDLAKKYEITDRTVRRYLSS